MEQVDLLKIQESHGRVYSEEDLPEITEGVHLDLHEDEQKGMIGHEWGATVKKGAQTVKMRDETVKITNIQKEGKFKTRRTLIPGYTGF